MKTTNPVFKGIEKEQAYDYERSASFQGIFVKTIIVLLVAVASALWASTLFETNPEGLYALLVGSVIIGFISVIIASFSVKLAMPFTILYALAEGVLLGTLTTIFESVYPGIGIIAISSTGVIFGVMLLLYSSRTIRVTSRFRKIMFGALIAILIMSILSMFGAFEMTEPVLLLVCGALILYGAFMLTLDFDHAESIVQAGVDKRFEWRVALGLMVTIVWIYIRLLQFIAIIMDRRN